MSATRPKPTHAKHDQLAAGLLRVFETPNFAMGLDPMNIVEAVCIAGQKVADSLDKHAAAVNRLAAALEAGRAGGSETP